ncbi:hypothetical protein BGZ75_001846, partial [Mortierella antarctica]
MSNPPNSSPPANRSLTPPSSANGPSVNHDAAMVSSQQASQGSGGDKKSTSSQKARKRDKIRNFFRSTKHEDKVPIQDGTTETKMCPARDAKTNIASAVSSLKVSSSETGSQLTISDGEARLNVFSEN